MKIIHCVNQYLPRHIAGTEVYIQTLGTFQKAAGHEVSVITPHIEHYRPGQIRNHYMYDGIDVYEYMETADPNNREIISGKKKAEGLSNFSELLKSLEPDVIHFHELNRSIGIGIEQVKLAKVFGAKVIVTMHLSFYTCNTNTLINHNKLCKGKILKFDCSICTYKSKFNMPSMLSVPTVITALLLERTQIISLLPKSRAKTMLAMPSMIKRIKRELLELSENVDRFVTLTHWYKKILLENGVPTEKLVIIPQALATIKEHSYKKNDQPVQLPIKMVFIGRIQSQKGIHLLVEAMNHFKAFQICLDIYGQTEDNEYYQQCINAAAGNESISWKGVIPREDVVGSLAKYDLLCLPSTFSEMSPLVIQEAFAAGIPVLASNVYGNAEQVRNGDNGWLFKFNDGNELKNKLQQLIDKPEMIQAAKARIQPVRGFADLADEYELLYNKAVTTS